MFVFFFFLWGAVIAGQKVTDMSETDSRNNSSEEFHLPLPQPHKSSSMVSSSTYEHPFHLEEMAGMMPTPSSTIKPSPQPPPLPERHNNIVQETHLPPLTINFDSNNPELLDVSEDADRLPTYDELAEYVTV